MRKSDINLEYEAFELMEGMDDLMSAGMASVFGLEILSRMSGQDLETIKLVNRQAKEYALHQAKKIDEIDHKICELYDLIEEKE